MPKDVAKKPKIKTKNNTVLKLSAKPIIKTEIGIDKAKIKLPFDISNPATSLLPIVLKTDETSAPAPATAVIKPKPDGPLENIPSEIRGKVSKIPLHINAVTPLRTIENLIILLDKINFVPSKNEYKIVSFLLFSILSSLGLIIVIKIIVGR